MKIFTQLVKVSKPYIDSVFSEGLQCRNNGEANGIWFSRGKKFYNYLHTFCFSLPYTEEMRKVGNFFIYDWENNADVLIAHNNIPIKYLKLEEGPLYAYKTKFNDRWGYLFENSSDASERFVQPSNVMKFDKGTKFVIFRDIFEHLFGYAPNESNYQGISNIMFDDFLFNEKWQL